MKQVSTTPSSATLPSWGRVMVPEGSAIPLHVPLSRARLHPAERPPARNRDLPRQAAMASFFCDAAIVAITFAACFWFRFLGPMRGMGVLNFNHLTYRDYFGYMGLGLASFLGILCYLGLYEKGAILRFRFTALQIMKGTAIWLGVFLALTTLLRFSNDVSRIFVAITAIGVPGVLMIWRAALWSALHRTGVLTSLRQRVAFVGWDQHAARLSHFFSDSDSAYEVIGYLEGARAPLRVKPTCRLLGHVQDIEEIIPEKGLDVVILADLDCDHDEIVHLANSCEKELAQFKVIPAFFQVLVSGLHLETMRGVPVLGVSRLPLDLIYNVVLKRIVDIVGALIGLILSLPMLAIFGALVYFESPGPILYRQRRWGRNGVPFEIYKIRSMKLDAEANGKVGWSVKEDPRRLKIGGFLRKWNIDELPQFWNVLRGEMSLVGPRPERPELIQNFKHEIMHYNSRHKAKPGITGWAQVKGLRGDTDLSERIQCDLWYLENWSPILDFQIMFMTFLNNKNAC